MIHAICDFCGRDCGTDAVFLTMTPFRGVGRNKTSDRPFGTIGMRASFVMCDDCREERLLPAPSIECTMDTPNARYRDTVNRRYGVPVSAKELYLALHNAGSCGATEDETRGYEAGVDAAISILREMTGMDEESALDSLGEKEGDADGTE